MPTACYPNADPVVHRQRSPRSQGFSQDDGCEVSDACLDCPLSRCKHDDLDWYRFWRKRVKQLLIGQEIERDGLTIEEAAVRFRITDRQVFRIKRWCRLASKLLTPDDLEVFMRLAEGGAHDGAELRQVA